MFYLTDEEKKMLDGGYGEGAQLCMKIVCEMGKMYGAKRLLPVKSAHMDSCCYTTIWDAGLDLVEHLAAVGTKVRAASTTNITARDIEHCSELRTPPDFADKCRRIEKAFLTMGCIPTWSCAPYQCVNTPSFGEHIAWSESNAVNYINSVVGARTNRYPDLVDLCCAVVGRVPEFGLHLTENRKGDLLFEIRGLTAEDYSDPSTYALLGYIVGKESGTQIPVISGMPQTTSHDDLKAFSAASAASGSVGLFHAVGITPEAATAEDAFQGQTPKKTVHITPDTVRDAKKELTIADNEKVDLVLIGCPHASYPELVHISELLGERKVCEGTHFWIQTGRMQKDLAGRSGVSQRLEAAGAFLLNDSCINNLPMEAWGFDTIVTNSGKMAHYAPGTTGGKIAFATTEGCVKAAVEGRISL